MVEQNMAERGSEMTMPNASGGATEATVPAVGFDGDAPAAGRARDRLYRLDPVFYIIGAVVGIGFLVALFGTYVMPNPAVILAGTIILVVAVVAWIFAALFMIGVMLKRWFRGGGKTAKLR